MLALKFLGEKELSNKEAIWFVLSVFNLVQFNYINFVWLTKIRIKGFKKLFIKCKLQFNAFFLLFQKFY